MIWALLLGPLAAGGCLGWVTAGPGPGERGSEHKGVNMRGARVLWVVAALAVVVLALAACSGVTPGQQQDPGCKIAASAVSTLESTPKGQYDSGFGASLQQAFSASRVPAVQDQLQITMNALDVYTGNLSGDSQAEWDNVVLGINGVTSACGGGQ